jgi:hypothetical protein
MGWNDTSAADAKTGTVDYADEAFYDFLTDGSDTLYAVWKATVTFNGNGGSGCVATQDGYADGVALTLSTCAWTGHVFVGWAETATGAVVYADEALYDFFTDGSDTLYAIWEATVTFNGNGADGGPCVATQTEDADNVALEANACTRTDFTFVGWNSDGTAANAGTVEYDDEDASSGGEGGPHTAPADGSEASEALGPTLEAKRLVPVHFGYATQPQNRFLPSLLLRGTCIAERVYAPSTDLRGPSYVRAESGGSDVRRGGGTRSAG